MQSKFNKFRGKKVQAAQLTRRQKFVKRVYEEEERDARTAHFARQVQEELEDSEEEVNLPEIERTERETTRRRRLNEIDINDFLRHHRLQARQTHQESRQENGREDAEIEYVTIHDDFLNKVKKGYVIPKIVNHKAEGEERAEESDRAISPLYEYKENNDRDSNSESKYCEEEEVVLNQWPTIKKEVKSEDDQEAVENTPPRTVVFEETDHA